MVDVAVTEFQGNPWDRQRDKDGELEPHMWFQRMHQFYLPLGPGRSILQSYKQWRLAKARRRKQQPPNPDDIYCPSASWSTRSTEWRWKDRAQAWDEHQRLRALQEQEEALTKMLERHINLATTMQAAAWRRLKKMAEEDGDWNTLSPDEMRRLIKDAAALERQARGLPAWVVDIALMDDDELQARYRDLLERIGTAGEGAGPAGLEAPDA